MQEKGLKTLLILAQHLFGKRWEESLLNHLFGTTKQRGITIYNLTRQSIDQQLLLGIHKEWNSNGHHFQIRPEQRSLFQKGMRTQGYIEQKK